jgi:hypothetical protein
MRLKLISIVLASLAVLLGSATPAWADPPPQVVAGTPANGFATQYTGCLGGLRSAIARGDLAGVTLPSGVTVPSGFSGSFNPGGHYGTVAEEWFLRTVGGLSTEQLAALCASFE